MLSTPFSLAISCLIPFRTQKLSPFDSLRSLMAGRQADGSANQLIIDE